MRVLDTRRVRPAAVADAVASVVQAGGIVIFPTDTVYGIGCDPGQPGALDRIYAAKDRPRTKPLSLHLASVAEFREYAAGNALANALADAFLPGALTIIVPRPSYVDARVTAGFATLGLRVPRLELCRMLLERCGPLAATSANLSGTPAATGRGPAALPEADLYVDNGPTPLGAESSIVDVCGAEPHLVREGAVKKAMLEAVVGPLR